MSIMQFILDGIDYLAPENQFLLEALTKSIKANIEKIYASVNRLITAREIYLSQLDQHFKSQMDIQKNRILGAKHSLESQNSIVIPKYTRIELRTGVDNPSFNPEAEVIYLSPQSQYYIQNKEETVYQDHRNTKKMNLNNFSEKINDPINQAERIKKTAESQFIEIEESQGLFHIFQNKPMDKIGVDKNWTVDPITLTPRGLKK